MIIQRHIHFLFLVVTTHIGQPSTLEYPPCAEPGGEACGKIQTKQNIHSCCHIPQNT